MASVVVNGDTSGAVTLSAPAVAGTVTVTLPAASGTMASLASVTANGVTYVNSSGQPTSGSALVFNGSNFALGVSPSTNSANTSIEINKAGNGLSVFSNTDFRMSRNVYDDGAKYARSSETAVTYRLGNGTFEWYNAPTGTAGSAISFTQAMTLDASGNLLVGATTNVFGGRLEIVATGNMPGGGVKNDNSAQPTLGVWNAATTGDNVFTRFLTEAGGTARGTITYNRAGGLVAYNTTSDYRAKDIYGSITDSGALIDSTPVYMGKMKGATQERPMFIAHETPAYAHTGEKDAVDADGNPVYQQMDASSLVPVMWAEIQSLRKRLAALESA